jgi:hypothetical protein
VCKGPLGMAALPGVQRTQGALPQEALRRAAGAVGPASHQLRALVPETPVVHTDDTGWRVGGEPAPLMAFETDTRPSLRAAPALVTRQSRRASRLTRAGLG